MALLAPTLARYVLAAAFTLTGTWKISHWHEYGRSFTTLLPRFLRRLERQARVGFVVAEFACAALLAISPVVHGNAQEAAPLAGLALLVVLTVSIMLRPSVADCGCWTSPATEASDPDVKGVLIARNSFLILASLVATVPIRTAVPWITLLSSIAFAVVIAPVVLELPQVVSIVKYHGGVPKGESP